MGAIWTIIGIIILVVIFVVAFEMDHATRFCKEYNFTDSATRFCTDGYCACYNVVLNNSIPYRNITYIKDVTK